LKQHENLGFAGFLGFSGINPHNTGVRIASDSLKGTEQGQITHLCSTGHIGWVSHSQP
jgi:hypothetical protein